MDINNPPFGLTDRVSWCVQAIQNIWRRLNGISSSSGTIPALQQVTDAGNTTTNEIDIIGNTGTISAFIQQYNIGTQSDDSSTTISLSTSSDGSFNGIIAQTSDGTGTVQFASLRGGTSLLFPSAAVDETLAVTSQIPKMATFNDSGTGMQTVFNIPHGLSATPGWFSAEPASHDATGLFYIGANINDITLTYLTPPILGSGNLFWYWSAVE